MNRVKELREEARMSQRELALMVGVSQYNISYCESGKHTIKIDSAYEIALALSFALGRKVTIIDVFPPAVMTKTAIDARLKTMFEVLRRCIPFYKARRLCK